MEIVGTGSNSRGTKKNFEIWETKFLDHIGSLGLKDAILETKTTQKGTKTLMLPSKNCIIIRRQKLVLNNEKNFRQQQKSPKNNTRPTIQEKENLSLSRHTTRVREEAYSPLIDVFFVLPKIPT